MPLSVFVLAQVFRDSKSRTQSHHFREVGSRHVACVFGTRVEATSLRFAVSVGFMFAQFASCFVRFEVASWPFWCEWQVPATTVVTLEQTTDKISELLQVGALPHGVGIT